MKRIFLIIAAALFFSAAAFSQNGGVDTVYIDTPIVDTVAAPAMLAPTETVCFATRDSVDLMMDIYQPFIQAEGNPTIIFVFGGGFITGARDDAFYNSWFRAMTDLGYRVVSIDYRLGLKGVHKVDVAHADVVFKAINMAVEDAIAATNFLIEKAGRYSVDPSMILISGSSAGAITALQAEYEICNGGPLAAVLPEGFNYAGVMSFAGGIGNRHGPVGFRREPCPLMLLHGTSDKIVNYKKTAFANIGMFGSSVIVSKLEKKGYDNYWFLRYIGRQHEISCLMPYTVAHQAEFINRCCVGGQHIKIDALIDDSTLPDVTMGGSTKDLYKKEK